MTDMQVDRDGCSHTLLALDTNGTIVVHDDLVCHGQSKSRTVGFGGEKGIINGAQIFL